MSVKVGRPSPALVALCALSLGLGIFAAVVREGTPFADVVEYLEYSQGFAEGDPHLAAGSLRTVGIALLHVPAFFVARVLDIQDQRWVLPYAAVVHLALSLLFVIGSVRMGRGLARTCRADAKWERRSGLIAGFVAAVGPTTAYFGSIAMTDLPAAAALAFGIERALFAQPEEDDRAVGLACGVALGLAVMCAYKTIPLVALGWLGAIVSGLLRLGMSRGMARAGWTFVALSLVIGFQCWLDYWIRDRFGGSLVTYVMANVGPTLSALLWHLELNDAARSVYEMGLAGVPGGDPSVAATLPVPEVLTSATSSRFYLWNFDWFAAPWLAPFACIGVLAGLRRSLRRSPDQNGRRSERWGRWMAAGLPAVIGVGYAFASTWKGAKEVRLWLPILPFFAAYVAWGIAALCRLPKPALAKPFAITAAIALVAAAINAPRLLWIRGESTTAPLARAVKRLATLEQPEGEPLRVATSFPWSIMFRSPPDIEVVDLPRQLDKLGELTEEEVTLTLRTVRTLDALVVHSSFLSRTALDELGENAWVLRLHFELTSKFLVESAFWNAERDPGFGPILVLVNTARGWDIGRPLAQIQTAEDDREPIVELERTVLGVHEHFALTDARASLLPGDGVYWVEFDVDVKSDRVLADYDVLVRVGDASGNSFTTYRRAWWNKGRTSVLKRGSRWTEGFPVAPTQGPFGPCIGNVVRNLREDAEVGLYWNLATLDRNDVGYVHVTGQPKMTSGDLEQVPDDTAVIRIGAFAQGGEHDGYSSRLKR